MLRRSKIALPERPGSALERTNGIDAAAELAVSPLEETAIARLGVLGQQVVGIEGSQAPLGQFVFRATEECGDSLDFRPAYIDVAGGPGAAFAALTAGEAQSCVVPGTLAGRSHDLSREAQAIVIRRASVSSFASGRNAPLRVAAKREARKRSRRNWRLESLVLFVIYHPLVLIYDLLIIMAAEVGEGEQGREADQQYAADDVLHRAFITLWPGAALDQWAILLRTTGPRTARLAAVGSATDPRTAIAARGGQRKKQAERLETPGLRGRRAAYSTTISPGETSTGADSFWTSFFSVTLYSFSAQADTATAKAAASKAQSNLRDISQFLSCQRRSSYLLVIRM